MSMLFFLVKLNKFIIMKFKLLSLLILSSLIMSGCFYKKEEVAIEVIENTVIEEKSDITKEEIVELPIEADITEEEIVDLPIEPDTTEEEIVELPEFETILEYIELVANDETNQYIVEKPDNYGPILFGDSPTKFEADGVPATYIILVNKDLLNNSRLDDVVTFYLEKSVVDGECYFDILDGTIEESECPDLIEWHGPFVGKAFSFVQ